MNIEICKNDINKSYILKEYSNEIYNSKFNMYKLIFERIICIIIGSMLSFTLYNYIWIKKYRLEELNLNKMMEVLLGVSLIIVLYSIYLNKKDNKKNEYNLFNYMIGEFQTDLKGDMLILESKNIKINFDLKETELVYEETYLILKSNKENIIFLIPTKYNKLISIIEDRIDENR